MFSALASAMTSFTVRSATESHYGHLGTAVAGLEGTKKWPGILKFSLNVFYLPTLKQVVGQYKMWNEVKFWFTQMTFYNIYNRLIIRQANDVEENPGPTIFDIIDPTTTVCADYSQGNELLFGENAGKQCVAMSLSAIIYHHIEDVNLWTSSTLNNILGIGNNLYTSIRYSVRINDYLLLTDVPGIVSLFDKFVYITIQ